MNNHPNQPMETEAVYHHRLPIQIRFNDVDRYGHVNNNAYFAYYDLGKQEYLQNVLKVDYRSSEIVPVIANINADFIFPIFYGDDRRRFDGNGSRPPTTGGTGPRVRTDFGLTQLV